MDIRCSLDWLRYSAPSSYPLIQMIPHELALEQDKAIDPLPHYTHACPIWPAGRADWNVVNTKQGSLVTFGGKDLKDLADWGISGKSLVDYSRKTKFCRASRIDIAIDIHDRVCNPTDIIVAWAEGRVKSHAKLAEPRRPIDKEGNEAGNTVYVGSRTSETFLRVYNKGLEQGSAELWTRIELELKKSAARQAQQKIYASGINAVMSSKLQSYVHITGVGWWTEMIMQLPAASDVMKGTRKQTNKKQEWLEHQATPAVCKAIIEGNEYVRDQVLHALISRGNDTLTDNE